MYSGSLQSQYEEYQVSGVFVFPSQYLNLLENCCGSREGSVLILLCDICEYLSDTFDGLKL